MTLESTGERAQLVVTGGACLGGPAAVQARACPSPSLESGPQPLRGASARSEKPRQKLARERGGKGRRLHLSSSYCTPALSMAFDTRGLEISHGLGVSIAQMKNQGSKKENRSGNECIPTLASLLTSLEAAEEGTQGHISLPVHSLGSGPYCIHRED